MIFSDQLTISLVVRTNEILFLIQIPIRWRVSQWSKCSACNGKKGFRHRKVQCVKRAGHPGEDDIQADLKDCKGRSPKQKIECIGDRPCRKTCKETRETRNSTDTIRSLSLEEQHRLVDQFVDVGLARYLQSRGAKSWKRNAANGFRQMLHDWVTTNKEKRKRKSVNERHFETPKPGTIIRDPAPQDQEILIVAPYRDDRLRSNMSDRAFQESGDSAGISIDTKNKKVFKGMDAINVENMVKHHNVSKDLFNS